MAAGIEHVVQRLDVISREVETSFGRLTIGQLNWAPGRGRWSVAQCLDHLMTTNALYFPLLDAMQRGQYTAALWARVSPLSGVFGRFLIRSLDPANVTPMKTTARAEPSRSTLPADTVSRFLAHQRELVMRLNAIPATLNPATTMMASPLMGLVTYSVRDCLEIIAVHEARHLAQAHRVLQTPGFPERTR